MTLGNIRIGKKLALGFGFVVLVALILGAAGLFGISRISDDLAEVGTVRVPDLRILTRLNTLRTVIRAESLEAVLAGHSASRDADLRSILDTRYKTWEQFDKTWKALLATERRGAKEEQLLDTLRGHYETWRRLHREMDRTLELIVRAVTDEAKDISYEKFKELYTTLRPISDTLGQTLENLAGDNGENTAILVRTDLERAMFLKRFMLIAFVAGVLAAFAMTVAISKSITGPMATLVERLARLRNGDVSGDVPEALLSRGDEIGVLAGTIHDVTGDLRTQISEIKEAASSLAAASAQILVSVSEVAAGSEETAVAVVETTATMEELRTSAEITSKKSRDVAESAQQGLQVIQKGRGATDALFEAMKNIGERMSSIAETIVRLSEQSQEVGEITETVEDIAEQSNLLAVNAAVEAAKAGEHGRGFSVVAQEIKSLAGQSRQSAREVQRILRDIQKATGASVMAIEQGTKAVEQGSKDAIPSKESVQAIVRRFTESTQSAGQIAAANNELFAALGQATQAMGSIREAGERNVAGMKDLESAAGSLRDMGDRLAALVARYTV